LENQRLKEIVETKDRRIIMLEVQVAQLTKQMDEIKEKLLNAVKTASDMT
jgi:chaperonin cofactor prefoldin